MAIDHPRDALPTGYRLGSYEVLRLLGRGGFGFTYQARRSGVSGDMVAIKELFPYATAARASNQHVIAQHGADPQEIQDSVEMFHREAQLICALHHPHIVQGIDAFRANGTAYLVMRYVSGKNLRDSLRDPAGFRPSPHTLPTRFAQLLDALETLHGHNLLHCDIKPDNIFLGIDHEPILIDLGSARWHVAGVGSEGSSTYSHYFSAIEQMTDRYGPIGPWTDIYQLSAVLYRCITGGKLPDAVDRATESRDPYLPLSEIPEAAHYPKPLIAAIDHGLRVLPKHRPQSVTQWRNAMGSALPKPAPRKKAPSPPPATPPPVPVVFPSTSPDSQSEPQFPLPLPSPSTSPDLLLWLAGGLLIMIILIVFIIVTQ
jgi:serine/threonine protein kinase